MLILTLDSSSSLLFSDISLVLAILSISLSYANLFSSAALVFLIYSCRDLAFAIFSSSVRVDLGLLSVYLRRYDVNQIYLPYDLQLFLEVCVVLMLVNPL